MTVRTTRTLAWGSLAVAVILTVIGTVFVVLGWNTPQPASLFGPRAGALLWGLAEAYALWALLDQGGALEVAR